MGEMLPALIFCLRKEQEVECKTLFHYEIKHLCITVSFKSGNVDRSKPK